MSKRNREELMTKTLLYNSASIFISVCHSTLQNGFQFKNYLFDNIAKYFRCETRKRMSDTYFTTSRIDSHKTSAEKAEHSKLIDVQKDKPPQK